MIKNIYIISFHGKSTAFVPVLYPSAKTYYEMYGTKHDRYKWINPVIDFHYDLEEIKIEIRKNPPDIFGVGLYVWNFELSLAVCNWVKEEFPNCLVITGGPHQYFKYNDDWFKTHSFIDASLPSESYGELTVYDILENLNDDNTINWKNIEGIAHPNKKRNKVLYSNKKTYKHSFNWNFSPFHIQQQELQYYVKEFRNKHPDTILHGKLETTRGCPYTCTFCDWGGGVGSKVILKDMDNVKRDVEGLLSLDVTGITLCDANFGINGERDVKIIEFIADKKNKDFKNKDFPFIQYAGFSKTVKHTPFLKKILTLAADHDISNYYKISIQTFDSKIMQHIKRTDLRFNEHWELAKYLRENGSYDAIVELIIGLPGMTKDLWYEEFNIPYENDVIVRAYEWHLLPEAESYSPEYRKKFGIGTSKKLLSKEEWSIPSEIVVESSTYTREDYKDMLAIYISYLFFIQTGVYKNTIQKLLKEKNIKYGVFLKAFYEDCFLRMRNTQGNTFWHFYNHLDQYVKDEVNDIELRIDWNNDTSYSIPLFTYIMFEFYKNYDILNPILYDWLLELGADKDTLYEDEQLIYNPTRLNKSIRTGLLKRIKFKDFGCEKDIIRDLYNTYQFYYGSLFLGKKSLI